MEYPVYDFLTASKVERPLSSALKIWLDKFSNVFLERWREFAPTEIRVTPRAINSTTFELAQSSWSQPSIGVVININQGAAQGMIVAQRSDLLILLMEILSETVLERPVDRNLTTIEGSLCQLLLEQSVRTFGESWPEKEVMPIEMGPVDEQPNRTRLFPPKHEVLITGFDIETSCGAPAGPACIEWIFAKDALKKLLKVTDPVMPDPNSQNRIPVENISKIMVDICARLGSAELAMDDLIDLADGDIIKLDQRIEVPVTLLVNDHPAFQAWPGRCGDQQCLQVESIIS
jgi:flagellar motor switch protein FliM